MVPISPNVVKRCRPGYQLHPKLQPPGTSVANHPATSVGTSQENMRCAPAEAENSKLVRFLPGPEALELTEGNSIHKSIMSLANMFNSYIEYSAEFVLDT